MTPGIEDARPRTLAAARNLYQIQRQPYPRRSVVRYAFHMLLTVVTALVFRVVVVTTEALDAVPSPLTTGPSPSPGAGPFSSFHGIGLANVGCGTEAAKANEHRRIPSNKKRRGIRILMPAPSAGGVRHSGRSRAVWR
jgi:hypothetical protein